MTMDELDALFATSGMAEALPPARAEALAADLGRAAGMAVSPSSLAASDAALYGWARRGQETYLAVITAGAPPAEFSGSPWSIQPSGQAVTLLLCPPTHANACALRVRLPFTAPQAVGLRKSIGCGDRLGLATPGHVRAVRQGTLFPIFAQQSIREMTRTGRTPVEVMDDATWGVFQTGWRGGYGADADHLKTTDDVDRCIEAGFVLYTVDPGDHVQDDADAAVAASLRARFEQLPWSDLETTAGDVQRRYLDRTLDAGDVALTFDEAGLWRAAVKYGRAVAHTVRMVRHLVDRWPADAPPCELEVSVDETTSPTTPAEHYFVANELRRLGVRPVSLAPRFVGRFEKGVDYIGDLAEFEAQFQQHVAVARALGPYKLSLHSGSDKFSIYPIAARLAGDLVHVKTAGTSYLEALRAVAQVEPALFRDILAFALARYPTDRQSYHVSAEPARVPDPARSADSDLEGVLDAFDGRQVLHVTFGSALTARDVDGGYRFRDRLLPVLREHEEAHFAALERHFLRHIAPFG